jgi:hypothetical protein
MDSYVLNSDYSAAEYYSDDEYSRDLDLAILPTLCAIIILASGISDRGFLLRARLRAGAVHPGGISRSPPALKMSTN